MVLLLVSPTDLIPNSEEKSKRKSQKRTMSASSGLEFLQMVSEPEPDTKCVLARTLGPQEGGL